MKIGIFYATKTGTTEKCAKILQEKILSDKKESVKEVSLIRLGKAPDNLENYDVVIVGASVRMGAIHSKALKFLKKNSTTLLSKKTGIFICNGVEEATSNIISRNFLPDMLNHSFAVSSFGGELDLEKQHGFDRFVVSQLKKDTSMKQPMILDKEIQQFADKVCQLEMQ